jgi:hypothetical protein
MSGVGSVTHNPEVAGSLKGASRRVQPPLLFTNHSPPSYGFSVNPGEAHFLPDARSVVQDFASLDSGFLRARNIGVVVTGISLDPAARERTWTRFL